MPDLKLKGQDVTVCFMVGGVQKDTITDIRNFEVTFMLEIISEGYLGKKSKSRDEVFNGVSGKMELHYSSKDLVDLAFQLVDRAKSREPGLVVNIQATLNFPGGDRKRILLPDCSSGPMPFNNSGRAEFLKGTLDFKVSNPKVV